MIRETRLWIFPFFATLSSLFLTTLDRSTANAELTIDVLGLAVLALRLRLAGRFTR